jgi:hypothetical protein
MRTYASFFLLLLTLKLSAQVETVRMERSDPLTIDVYLGTWGLTQVVPGTSEPLGYCEIESCDFFSQDFSAYMGTTEFTMNYDPYIVDFGRSAGNPGSPVNIPILLDDSDLMHEISGHPLGVMPDKTAGNVWIAACIGWEGAPVEELAKNLKIDRTKEGRLIINLALLDADGFLSQRVPGFGDRGILSIPLKGGISDVRKNLRVVKDNKSSRYFALMSVYDGMRKIKTDASGNARITGRLVKPADPGIAEKTGITMFEIY